MGDLNMRWDPLKNDEDFFVKQAPGAEKAHVEILKDEKGARYGFYIDLGNVSSADAEEWLKRAKQDFKNRKFKKPDEPPPAQG